MLIIDGWNASEYPPADEWTSYSQSEFFLKSFRCWAAVIEKGNWFSDCQQPKIFWLVLLFRLCGKFPALNSLLPQRLGRFILEYNDLPLSRSGKFYNCNWILPSCRISTYFPYKTIFVPLDTGLLASSETALSGRNQELLKEQKRNFHCLEH